MTCPKCKGKGFVTATKGEIPDVDEKITEDLNEADTAIDDAKDEQAKDNAQHEAKKTKKKVSKAARRLAKESAKARVKKGHIVVSESELAKLQSVHDTLCPAFESVPALAKKSVVATIRPEMFADRLSAISGSKATPGSIAEASEAYLAAHAVSQVSAKSLTHLRELAHKTFTTAYPNLRVNSPDLSSPEAFRRGFLGSANKETATSMNHPNNFPNAKPLDAADFQRGPLVANEARPSLMGGTPAKDLVAHKRKAPSTRQFYRNVDKDKNVKAMAILHDHIASNYPSVCPMSGAHAIADETEDRLGTPPEMYSPASSVTQIDAKADAKPKPVHARANKGRGRSLDLAAIKPVLDEYMTEQLSSVTKSYTKRIGKLEAKLKKVAAAPDPAQASNRLTRFQTTKAFVPEVDESKKETVKRAKSLTRDIRDRNSTFAQQAVVELQDLVSAKEFASLMISDDE